MREGCEHPQEGPCAQRREEPAYAAACGTRDHVTGTCAACCPPAGSRDQSGPSMPLTGTAHKQQSLMLLAASQVGFPSVEKLRCSYCCAAVAHGLLEDVHTMPSEVAAGPPTPLYWWPGLYDDVIDFICTKEQGTTHFPAGMIQSFSFDIPSRCFGSAVSTTPLPRVSHSISVQAVQLQQYNSSLVLVDYLPMMAKFIFLPSGRCISCVLNLALYHCYNCQMPLFLSSLFLFFEAPSSTCTSGMLCTSNRK
jgi:hypothetical protein